MPFPFKSWNFVPSALHPEPYVRESHDEWLPVAYAGAARTAANTAASIVAIRRDDRVIEPSLLPVGKNAQVPS